MDNLRFSCMLQDVVLYELILCDVGSIHYVEHPAIELAIFGSQEDSIDHIIHMDQWKFAGAIAKNDKKASYLVGNFRC